MHSKCALLGVLGGSSHYSCWLTNHPTDWVFSVFVDLWKKMNLELKQQNKHVLFCAFTVYYLEPCDLRERPPHTPPRPCYSITRCNQSELAPRHEHSYRHISRASLTDPVSDQARTHIIQHNPSPIEYISTQQALLLKISAGSWLVQSRHMWQVLANRKSERWGFSYLPRCCYCYYCMCVHICVCVHRATGYAC